MKGTHVNLHLKQSTELSSRGKTESKYGLEVFLLMLMFCKKLKGNENVKADNKNGNFWSEAFLRFSCFTVHQSTKEPNNFKLSR